MSSFYGGKQGRSYRIVEHYDSINDMAVAFHQGDSYIDVGYGEYVIIDTIINNNKKSSFENGILYRRGYNHSEEIKANGPVEVKAAWDAYQQAIGTTREESNYNNYISIKKNYVEHPGGGAIYVGQIIGPQGEASRIQMLPWEDFQTTTGADGIKGIMNPVPGYDNGVVKDNIDYGYYTIQDEDGDVLGAYISFNFPYTVFNFEAELVEPYDVETVIEEQDDSIGHPYYKHYKLSIPEGKHGTDVEEIGIYQKSGNNYELINTASVTDKNNLFFGYKLRSYNNSKTGDELPSDPQGLISYKVIKNITVTEPADKNVPKKLKVEYTDGSADNFNYNIIESISVNEETKAVTITLSNRQSISYTPREVMNIGRDSDSKELVITYNDNTTASLPITEMADIKLEGDNVLIGFRNLDTMQATALFPASMISQADGLTYINFGGVIRGQHILRNFTTYNDLITTYPNGLTGESKGWLVTVGDSTNGYDLYAYDYNSSVWYSIQHIGANLVEPELSILLEKEGNDGQPINNRGAQLNDNGIWLIKEGEEKPVFNLYLDSDGNLWDSPYVGDGSEISLTVNDILTKIQQGYQIQAVWDASGLHRYDEELLLNTYNLNTEYIEFISAYGRGSFMAVLYGTGTDDVLSYDIIEI